jgi:hypothetical protein
MWGYCMVPSFKEHTISGNQFTGTFRISILFFPLHSSPANAVFMSHFPLYRRFTYATLVFSISQALMAAIVSYGLIYLGNYLGYYGLWVISLPIAVLYLYGIFHFTALEHQAKLYPNLS